MPQNKPAASPVKTAFLLSSKWALPCLQELIKNHDLAGVAIPSQARELLGLVRHSYPSISPIITVLHRKNLEEEMTRWLNKTKPDVLLVLTFPFKVPARVLTIPPLGVFNFHGGALPRYAGNNPVFWQVRNRETEAVLSVHRMDETIDTGPIAFTTRTPISPDDTFGSVYMRLSYHAQGAMIELLEKLSTQGSSIALTPQSSPNIGTTYTSKPRLEDITIQWDTQDSLDIIALVNACNPWTRGAATSIRDIPVRILSVRQVPNTGTPPPPGTQPGTIITMDEKNGIQVYCRDGKILEIDLVHLEIGFFHALKLMHLGIIKGEMFK